MTVTREGKRQRCRSARLKTAQTKLDAELPRCASAG
jgi:hypothetical protein